jgi:hypothetical protein
MPNDHDVIVAGLHLIGGRYVLGAKNPGPNKNYRSDCSGYISGVCRAVGVPMAAGSVAQEAFCRDHGTYHGGAAGVEWARNHPGSLLFRHAGTGGHSIGHVVLVGSHDKTLEYMGTAYGSGSWGISGRPWTGGALIPGVSYASVPLQIPTQPLPTRPSLGPGSPRSHCIAIASYYLKGITGHAIPQVDVWNPFLESTVRDLQTILHMPVTGRLDRNTWAAVDMIVIHMTGKPGNPC